MEDAGAVEIRQNKENSERLWAAMIEYARQVEQRSDAYARRVGDHGEQALEQSRGLLHWVARTKGSYDSQLWEMEVLLNHLSGNDNAEAYFGYDTTVHPDVAIVDRKANTAVAIEVKQVESVEAKQVHVNVYKAMDQLWSRERFDAHTPYTRWKMYVYVNADNPWPWTKPADQGKTFAALVDEKADEQRKTVHWTNWTALGGEHKVEVSIWHGAHGRRDYVLRP